MLPSADEDNDDVIESFWLYIFSVFPSFVYYYLDGFLPNKSCVTQLLPFSHDISLGLNFGELIDAVYFDFAKAFDSVNHDIILHKLKYQFGIDGHMLKFIKEYLKGRKQRVLVYGKFSTILDVKSGVPQGSILGPLLLVLFINDIHTKISENTQIMLYADDTKIWRHILAPIDHEILQRDIDALNAWATLNKMKLNFTQKNVKYCLSTTLTITLYKNCLSIYINYSAQKSKTSLLEASFGVRGGQLWNTLPENIKVAPSLEALKARLGHYLVEIPDWPPTTSYSIEHNNSLLEWARRRGAQ